MKIIIHFFKYDSYKFSTLPHLFLHHNNLPISSTPVSDSSAAARTELLKQLNSTTEKN